MGSMDRGQILVVGNEIELINPLRENLIHQAYLVGESINSIQVTQALRKNDFDILVIDVTAPGINGIDLLREVHHLYPDLMCVIIIDQANYQPAQETVKNNFYDYLRKPFRLSDLLAVIDRAMEIRCLRVENVKLRETIKRYESNIPAKTGAAAAGFMQDEVALRESEERFRALAQSISDAIIIANQHGEIILWNKGAEHLFLYKEQEVLGQPMTILIPEPYLTLHKEAIQRFNTTGISRSNGKANEVYALRKDGSQFPAEITLSSWGSAEGRFSGTIIRDVTERKQAIETSRQNEERFRALIENSSDAISLLGGDGKLIYVSPSTQRILGYSTEEAVGRDPLEWIHPDDQAMILTLLSKVFQNPGMIFTAQYRVRHQDGSWRWIDASINNLLGATSVQAVIFNYRDVTERKQSETALASAHTQLREINEIISAASQAGSSLKEILEAILDTTLAAFDLNMGVIWTESGETVLRNVPPEFGPAIEQTMRSNEIIVSCPTATQDWQAVPETSPAGPVAAVMAHFGIRADLVAPLLRDGQRIGGLSIMAAQPRSWMVDEIALLESIGRQVGIVADRARLFEETRSRMAELEAVNRVSTALRTVQTLDEMLPLLLDETLSMLHTKLGSIWLFNDDLHKLSPVVTRGWELAGGVTLTPEIAGEEIAEHVFASGQVHISSEFHADPDLSESTRQRIPQDAAGAVIPIRAATKVIGVLFVNLKKPRLLARGEISLLTTLAEIAGNAIQRMRLHAQTEIQLQHLMALREIDVAISGSFDPRLTFNVILTQVKEQLGVDATAILLLNPHIQTLGFAAGRGFHTRLIEGTRLRMGEGLAGRAALERKPISALISIQEKSDFTRSPLLAAEGFVAYQAVPLITKGVVKGILEIFHRTPLDPTPEWFGFLETLAGQAAIATENYQLFESLQRSNSDLALAYDATIEGWSKALDLRDNETEGHTQRVTELSLRLARVMGFTGEELTYIRWGALLHDIGKMGVPDSILLKPGPLTDEEWVIMRKHTTYAYEMLSPIAYLRPAIDIPYCHHEKWDGTGYPRGLKGEVIPMVARIFAVVDVWDALRSDRPYRLAWPAEKVRTYIHEQAGTHFDPQIVDVFMTLDLLNG